MATKDPISVWSSSSDGNPESPTFYLLSNPSDYFRDDDLDNFFRDDTVHDHEHGLLIACSDIEWTRNDDKLFESAIAELGSDTPSLFAAIAARVPGKTVEEIEKHYILLVEDLETIESGCFPVPEYDDDDDDDDIESVKNGTDEDDDDGDGEGDPEGSKRKNKRRRKGKVAGEFRRRGTPWTDEEHSKYGRGDWRSISRNYVITKTPTQVASHAQKYFLRMETNAANSDKRRRPSQLDQTLPNLPNHGNAMTMMDHLQNLAMAQNNNYRPIMAAPSNPLVPQVPPPIYTSFTNNYDFVGANNRSVQNQYGGAFSSVPSPRMPVYPTAPVSTMNLPSSSSLYDYNFHYGASSSSVNPGPSQAGLGHPSF
ncbi:hypothetical protein Syun_005652 [Stephania yunnanensis]|uniref:HTH myb-type domain-containing protein n=1 Tax=Stephania yunnanensis TaxID=152371 RepID=A0AAP0L651_9MAGN